MGDVELAPKTETGGQFGDFRELLLGWGLPEYLCDAMRSSGWQNKYLWDRITDIHLIKMGFKDGHRETFHYEYAKWKRTTRRIRKELTYKDLLHEWDIPIHLHGMMKMNGWSNIHLWYKLVDEEEQKTGYKLLKSMGFKMGHIETFKAYVTQNAGKDGKVDDEDNDEVKGDHIQQFRKIKTNLTNNKTEIVAENDYHQEDEEILDAITKAPNVPKFNIDKEQIDTEGFELELTDWNKLDFYIVQYREAQTNGPWKNSAQIAQTNKQRIDGLKSETEYSVRVRAQNAFKKSSDWSQECKVKTMNESWLAAKSEKIKTLEYRIKYHETNKNGILSIHFQQEEIKKIIDDKVDELFKTQYYMEIGLAQSDIDIDEQKGTQAIDDITWNKICDLNAENLNYKHQMQVTTSEYPYILLRVCSRSGLGYIQWSSVKQLEKIKQVPHQVTYQGYNVTIRFDSKEIAKMKNDNVKNDIYKQQYYLEIGLVKHDIDINDEKQCDDIKWNKVSDLSESTGYSYNLKGIANTNKYMITRICSKNGLGFIQTSSVQKTRHSVQLKIRLTKALSGEKTPTASKKPDINKAIALAVIEASMNVHIDRYPDKLQFRQIELYTIKRKKCVLDYKGTASTSMKDSSSKAIDGSLSTLCESTDQYGGTEHMIEFVVDSDKNPFVYDITDIGYVKIYNNVQENTMNRIRGVELSLTDGHSKKKYNITETNAEIEISASAFRY